MIQCVMKYVAGEILIGGAVAVVDGRCPEHKILSLELRQLKTARC